MQAYLSFFDKLDKKLPLVASEIKYQLALDICKKLFPDYLSFTNKHHSGDASVLQRAVDYCQSQIQNKSLNADELSSIIDSIEELVPDTDEFSTWDISYASNAVASVLELLKYLDDGNDKHLSEICSLWIDTVDFKIAEENEHLSDDGIFKHPHMLATMKEIMDKLESVS